MMNKRGRIFPVGFRWLAVVALGFTFLAPARAYDTLYWGGGFADGVENTPLPAETNGLRGAWNDVHRNWATSATPGPYTNFSSGAFANLGQLTNTPDSAAALIAVQSDFEIAGIFAAMTTSANGYNQAFRLTNNVRSTLTLAETGASIIVAANENSLTRRLEIQSNVVLSGSAPLHFLGTSRTILKSASTNLTGDVTMRSSLLVDSDGPGSLAGVTNFHVRSDILVPGAVVPTYILYFWVSAPGTGVVNQLHDNAAIALSWGKFTYSGRYHATDATDETIGKIALRPHGILDISTAQSTSGADRPSLILSDATAGLDRGPSGRGTMVVVVTGSGHPTNDVVVQNGVPTGVVLPWIATTRAEFMQLNPSTKVLETVASTPAPTNLSTWVDGSNYRLGNNTAWVSSEYIDSDLTINSLGFYGSTSISTVLVDNASTLTIGSGGLTFYSASQNHVISGGRLTSTNGVLYVLTGESAATASLTISSVIAGEGMDLVKGGTSELTLTGSSTNTYTGTTYVNGGTLRASKSGSAVGIPGNLVVEVGGLFNASGSRPISATSAVTVNEGGVFLAAGPTIHGATLTINGGDYVVPNQFPSINALGEGLAFNGGRIQYDSSGGGSFSLQTDVRYASDSTRQARWELLNTNGLTTFGIELDGGARTFNIADSLSLPSGTPEMVVDAPIRPGTPAGGSLIKTGAGTLQLTTPNTYTGGTTINDGVLHLSTIRGVAISNLTVSTAPGGALSRVLTFNQPIANALANRQPIWSEAGTNVLPAQAFIVRAINDYQAMMAFGGSTRVTVNTISDVTVGEMSRSGNLGTGSVTINGGILLVDAGITMTNTATLNAGSFEMNGTYDGSLTMTNGTLGGTGTVVKSTTVRGVLAPGADETGTIYFATDLTLAADATLAIQSSASRVDLVEVAGTANLDGMLQVINTDLELDAGLVITVLTASAISGEFDSLDLPALDCECDWEVNYEEFAVTLEIVSTGGPSAPTVGPVTFTRAYGEDFKIAITNLMTNSFDAGGGPLALTWVSATSSNGHPVTTNDVWVFYTPPASSNETDYFNFRLANTNGVEAESTATILVDPPVTNIVNITSAIVTNGGVVSFTWAGIPGRSNSVEGATILAPGNWSNIGYQVLSEIGQATFRETNPPSPRYYRITE